MKRLKNIFQLSPIGNILGAATFVPTTFLLTKFDKVTIVLKFTVPVQA